MEKALGGKEETHIMKAGLGVCTGLQDQGQFSLPYPMGRRVECFNSRHLPWRLDLGNLADEHINEPEGELGG